MKINFFLCLLLATMVSSHVHANPAPLKDTLNLHWRDTNVLPENDFYSYANGTWKKQNPIPPEYAAWGVFHILQERVQDQIHEILLAASNNPNAKPGSIEQKVGDFYFSGMNEKEINQLGITPLKDDIAKIQALQNTKDLQNIIADLQKKGVNVLFNFGSMQDFKNSDQMIGIAIQGGLGLPDRDYYLKKDPKSVKIQQGYIKHIQDIFILTGKSEKEAKIAANNIMQFETRLAEASMSNIAMRDPHAIYHPMLINEIQKLTPHFSWSTYLENLGLSHVTNMNMATPEFFRFIDTQIQTLPLHTWKSYLEWQLLDTFASTLSTPFVEANFRMQQLLSGTEKLLPRWKRVVTKENSALGFAIGKLYVEKYFSPEAKNQVKQIVNNIRATMADEIRSVPWMNESTRKAALEKLMKIKERIGYPDTWWDYTKLKIDRGPYVLNVMRANQFLVQRDLNKIGKPVDTNEWAMTPQTVNAYYDPSMNNINLPAAILQTPMFNPDAPTAVNYGAIGFVIGHEITHGFDDQGAKFDGSGNLKNWWSPEDKKRFQTATKCIEDQFGQYKVDDLNLQGKLVVGEATADLGGLTIAWKAFKGSDAWKKASIIENLTPAQQFFLSSAHVWATNIRPELARSYVTLDSHPPGLYRVNGTLANMPAFQEAFGIHKPGHMKNEKPCVIW